MKILLILSFVLFLIGLKELEAVEFNDENCIRAIIGECSCGGFDGMYNIACALRNRGTLKGVYGYNAKHIDSENRNTWELAKQAWEESEYRRSHLADHWGSRNVDKKWVDKMMKSSKYKFIMQDKWHMFFKEV